MTRHLALALLLLACGPADETVAQDSGCSKAACDGCCGPGSAWDRCAGGDCADWRDRCAAQCRAWRLDADAAGELSCVYDWGACE